MDKKHSDSMGTASQVHGYLLSYLVNDQLKLVLTIFSKSRLDEMSAIVPRHKCHKMCEEAADEIKLTYST